MPRTVGAERMGVGVLLNNDPDQYRDSEIG